MFTGNTLNLITINMGGYHEWKGRVPALIKLIADVSPDCIALEEVLTNHAFFTFSSSDFIADRRGYTYRVFAPTYARNNSRDIEGNRTQRASYGLTFLSKQSIISSESYFLMLYAEHPEESTVLFSTIEASDRQVEICNVHFANSGVAYLHLDTPLPLVDKRQANPIIVEDFNVYKLADYKKKNAALERYTLSTDLVDYISYPADNDSLDYIAAPMTQYSLRDVVCHEKNVSDHKALSARIEIA